MIILPFLLATSLVITPTVIPTPTTTSEIQKFREVIQEKVKAKLQEISQVVDTDIKRGYFGTITKIEDDKINIDTKNKNQQIYLNTDVVFLNAKSIKIKLADLKIGQEILVIGLLNNQNNFTAKRIILTPFKTHQNLKTTIYGQVVDVSTTYSLIALIPLSNKNTQYQIKVDIKNIQIISKDGTKLSIKDITKGKKIIVIFPSSPISNQTLSAEKIIVL